MTRPPARRTPGPVESATTRWLLAAGLLSTRAVTDGSLRVSRAVGRNTTLMVTTRDDPSYVVKYGRDGHEAAAYAFLGTVAGREVRAALPTVVAHAAPDNMLVLEHIDGPNLRIHHTRLGRCPASWASRAGALLADVHALPLTGVRAALQDVRIRAVHRPDESLFVTSSHAAVELTALIQSDAALCTALDEQVGRAAATGFIHGDVRWDNLVVDRDGGDRPAGLRLVDWESAGVGDPGWDIGCLLADYVSHWINSIPFTTAATAATDAARARVPLATARTAIAAAWGAYVARRPDRCVGGPVGLRRVIGHVAHRLLRRALEIDQYSGDVSLAAACHVQLGAQMMAQPELAATVLLGLPVGHADG